MNFQKSTRLLALLLVFALLLSACEDEKANSSLDEIEAEINEADVVLVDEDDLTVSVFFPENTFELRSDYTEKMGALYYGRYDAWRPDVLYSYSDISALQMDIAVYVGTNGLDGEDLREEFMAGYEDEDGYMALDPVWIGDWIYYRLNYTGTATDGTDYKAHLLCTTKDDYLIFFLIVEYTGSDTYVTYGEMTDYWAQVLASLTVEEKETGTDTDSDTDAE